MPEGDNGQGQGAQGQGGTPAGAQQQPGQQPGAQSQGAQPQTFDAWLEGQDEAIKGLITDHTKGLKSALDSERGQRRELAKQLAEATKGLEEGSQARQALEKANAELELAERRAVFAEEAVRPEVGCANPKAAFLVAQADSLFDSRGNPDWNAIKAAAPELFAKKGPANANPGAGTQQPTPAGGMNAFIRAAAGRG